MPATETIDFEREFEELVRELRALPTAAPDRVREHVRALGEPASRGSVPTLPWRRAALVLAPACVLAVLSAAAVYGVLNSSNSRAREVTVGRSGASDAERARLNPRGPVPGAAIVPPDRSRHQDYAAWLTVRVTDLDALTEQTNEAMRIARAYGGYVASVQQSTPAGKPGQADLVLRVPVARVEQALVRLGELGTVLDRHLSVVDLERVLQQQRERINRLRLFIARALEQLQRDLPADVRLRLQLQLQQVRADLERTTRAQKGTLDRAALSRISLTLTTQKAAAPVKKTDSGRFERAASEAASFLAGAGAVLLFLLIVLSPVLVLVGGTLLALRAYRRREERRLLAST
jgi:Domain of unknown function (DUF4349)